MVTSAPDAGPRSRHTPPDRTSAESRSASSSASLLRPMSEPSFALQSHSTLSDGALSPADVVAAATAAGVELLALSDHDSALGVAEAAQAARAAGIGLVPATEITALLDGKQDLHVCAYLIDPEEPTLVQTLERSRNDRERRAEEMSAALRELGFAIDESQLRQRTEEG